MCPMKLVWYFLHTSWVTIYAAYIKNFYKSVQNDFWEKEKEKKGKAIAGGMKMNRFSPATTKMNMGKTKRSKRLAWLFSMLFPGCNSQPSMEMHENEECIASGVGNVNGNKIKWKH